MTYPGYQSGICTEYIRREIQVGVSAHKAFK